jgi:putative RecB family exonuclease
MFAVPTTLSPSGVARFTACPMAFRFSSIERLPEPPSVHTLKGSLVHRALELAYLRPAEERTPDAFRATLRVARDEFVASGELGKLDLSDDARDEFDADCAELVERYLRMEDPTTVRAIGLELRLEAPVESLHLRGVIDRLDLRDGELVVTDYKTGRAPTVNWEQQSLAGVHFYSFLCAAVFGRRPAAIRLMYLRTGETIEATPSERSVRFLNVRATAVWRAIEKACQTGDFRPRPGSLCASCSFRPWCPSFGGDPDRAALELAPPALVTS